jgi:hypothetical protein
MSLSGYKTILTFVVDKTPTTIKIPELSRMIAWDFKGIEHNAARTIPCGKPSG